MPKVYIAAAFRSISERGPQEKDKAYGTVVDLDYIAFLESIEDVFLKFGFDTCLPHRDEGMWGRAYFDPADISALCYRHIENSDMLFGIAEGGRGVHIEFGYAARAKKRMVLAFHKDKEPSTLIWGFPKDISPWQLGFGGETETTIFSYSSKSDLLEQLAALLESSTPESTRTKASHSKRTTGIIDIGSHTVKLRIFFHAVGAAPRLLHERKESLGIIGGMNSRNQLTPESVSSLVAILKQYVSICESNNCNGIAAVGTAALRKATNAESVLKTIRDAVGLAITTLSPETELGYVFNAVAQTFSTKDTIAVLNLGGGSTQIGVGTVSCLAHSFLLPIGTRQITDKWPWTEGFTPDTYEEMRLFVMRTIRTTIPEGCVSSKQMVHTGGELDFLLRCRVPMEVCVNSAKHVSQISVNDFREFSRQLSKMKAADVAARFRLDPAWASGAIASNLIALCVADCLHVEKLVPSNLNVADGVLAAQYHNS